MQNQELVGSTTNYEFPKVWVQRRNWQTKLVICFWTLGIVVKNLSRPWKLWQQTAPWFSWTNRPTSKMPIVFAMVRQAIPTKCGCLMSYRQLTLTMRCLPMVSLLYGWDIIGNPLAAPGAERETVKLWTSNHIYRIVQVLWTVNASRSPAETRWNWRSAIEMCNLHAR